MLARLEVVLPPTVERRKVLRNMYCSSDSWRMSGRLSAPKAVVGHDAAACPPAELAKSRPKD